MPAHEHAGTATHTRAQFHTAQHTEGPENWPTAPHYSPQKIACIQPLPSDLPLTDPADSDYNPLSLQCPKPLSSHYSEATVTRLGLTQ